MIVSVLSWYHWGDTIRIERNAKEQMLLKPPINSKHQIYHLFVLISRCFLFILGFIESSTPVNVSNNILDEDDLIMDNMNCNSRTDDEDIDNVFADGVLSRRLEYSISQSTLPYHKTTSKKDVWYWIVNSCATCFASTLSSLSHSLLSLFNRWYEWIEIALMGLFVWLLACLCL